MTEVITRYIQSQIKSDLARKMVFLCGPRQCGKTTLGLDLLRKKKLSEKRWYLNWDVSEDRHRILEEKFTPGRGMLILDEVHKYSDWRQLVKGLFDRRRDEIEILVTGSARLDYYRRGGDSLQGRYYFHRLHPLTLKEIGDGNKRELEALLRFGGFPEPFMSQSVTESRRWSRNYQTRILEEEIRDLENVRDLSRFQKLAVALPSRVGSPLSVNSLREDLNASHPTISSWIDILERTYMLFRIYPYTRSILKSVKKEAKHYHFDWTVVKDEPYRFENMVACHLLKWCHYKEDTQGRDMRLHFFRDMNGRELDFLIAEDEIPIMLVECKKGLRYVNPALRYLKRRFPTVVAWQVGLNIKDDYIDKEGVRHSSAEILLRDLV